MKLVLKIAEKDVDDLVRRNIRVLFLGSKERLSKKVVETLRRCEEKSAHCTKGTLALCFNYGGQDEIIAACKKIVNDKIASQDITKETLSQAMYHPGVPELDLIVRTSGEQRLSNFLLWRSAYSEFLFLEKNWPEMSKGDVAGILDEYARRNRRFGGS
jgi:undecaprenyl diphosphate synthase